MTQFLNPSKIVAAYTADLWEHVCPTIRITEPLQAAGFQVYRGVIWSDGIFEVDISIIPKADFVLIARDFPNRSDAYCRVIETARSHQKPVIYELDDLLVDLPATHPDVDHYLSIKPGVIQAVIDADAVTVSTPGLEDYLKPFNPNIFILPNFLIDRFWKFPPVSTPQDDDAPVIIGYMGGHGHKPDLEGIEPVLERLLEKYRGRIQLMFWGIHPPEKWQDLPNVRWTIPYLVAYETFAEYFLSQSADIFIAPLQDNLFNRCKSPLKFIEYSALGIPGVYADLPSYRDLITQGENGYLAATPEEWEVALSALIDDAALRVKVGAAAQKTVQEKCLLSPNAYRWQEAYQNIQRQPAGRERLAALALQSKFLQTWYASLADGYAAEKKTRLRLLEENKQLQFDLQNMTHQANSLRAQMDGILNSRGWKMLQRVYEARLKLMPRGSKRERLVRLGYRSAVTLRREGPGALARRAWQKITGQVPLPEMTQSADPGRVAFSVQPGKPVPGPLVSIIVLRPEFDGEVEDVLRWVAAATFRSCEVVFWDRAEGQAWKAGGEGKFPASDYTSLKSFLQGKYVCFASADLLAQEPTYLEMNVTALETEDLAFTVNIHWNEQALAQKLQSGEFPGSPQLPLVRQVVAKNWVDNGLKIDFSDCTADAFLAGKFILNETSQQDKLGSWPFLPAPSSYEFTVDGQWIIGCRPGRKDLFPVQHNIHQIETVLPLVRPELSKPVIVVLIQFLAVGGAERLLLKLVDHLKDEFTFVIISMERQAGHLGTTADSFRKVTPYVYPLATFLNPALNFSYLTHLIDRFQPKALYIANGSPWIYDALHELRKRFPTLRMVNQVYDHQYGWINRYDPVIVSSLDGNISANVKISEAYVQKGVRPEQVYFIEHCIDMVEVNPDRYSAEKIAEIKSRLGLPKGKKIVAFIARFHPQKRPMDFVELSRRSVSDPSLHFLMVGEGPLSKAVDDYMRKNQPRNLTVSRFYKPITDIYAVMDALVLPSEYEAMPLVVLEAQAMGKPVVVTDVGSNRDVVEDTGGGVVIPKVGDIKALSDGVKKIFAEPIDGARVRGKIQDRFGTEKIAAQYRAAILGEKNA